MITEERKEELLEMEEYYNYLSEEEFLEERSSYENWWRSLTLEEVEFLDEEWEKQDHFISTTTTEILELIKKRDDRSER